MLNIINKKEIKLALIGILAFFIYMLLPKLQGLPFAIVGIDTESIPMYLKIIYMISFEIVLMAIIIFLFKDKLMKDRKDIKINHKIYFEKYLKVWLLSIGVMMISNLFISFLLPGELPSNEEALRKLFNESPIYIFFSAVIFAPIVEELVFRQGFRYIFKTDIIFILISGLVFGSLHVFTSAESFTELLYIIPYSAPGIGFAYILTKTKNVLVTIGFHFIHNGILVALQFLLLIFG